MTLLLWLFAIDLGIAFGAGLYEQRIVLPQWFPRGGVDSEAMRKIDTGRRFWGAVTTLPLTLLTLASLAVAWRAQGPAREWWLGAAAVTLVERLGTFSYLIPTAMKLMRAEALPQGRAAQMAAQWRRLNLLRSALGLAGWLLALKALSLISTLRG